MKMTFTRKTSAGYDAVLGKPTAPTSVDFPVWGIKASLGKVTKYAEYATKFQSLIAAGAIMLITEVTDYVPTKGDKVLVGSDYWTVDVSDSTGPAGVDVLWVIMVVR